MHIVNSHGIIHTIEDGTPLPTGARTATEAEAAYYEEPNSDCIAENAVKPPTARGKKANVEQPTA